MTRYNPHREEIIKRIKEGYRYQAIGDAFGLTRAQISQYAKSIGHIRQGHGRTPFHHFSSPNKITLPKLPPVPKLVMEDPEEPMLDKPKAESRVVNGYTVEPDIPIPGGENSRRAVYPFGDMNIGESFAFPHSKLESVRRSASAYKHRHDGVRFVFRQMDNNTWRCWKLENNGQ